ncbi:zinc finger MYM-type protein 1 [Tanacetum coccineum]
MKKKQKRVDSFFQRTVSPRIEENTTIEEENKEQPRDENPPPILAVENATFSSIQRDPGVRQPIWNYPVNKRDEIRRAYLNVGPHRLMLPKYPSTGSKTHPRHFQAKWYSEYPWLEYSRVTDRAYCFYCYLFSEEPSANTGQNAFAINGFKNWNMGILIRGRDKRVSSKNRGNFLEIHSLVCSYNEEIASIVLENAPGNAIYTSPDVQKEVLNLYAEKVQKKIAEDI